MTIYGRRDLVSVTVSEAHGGCGALHEYTPGPGGCVQLTCDKGCEEWLRTDAMHDTSPRDVPETYDETKDREALTKQGARNRDYLTAAALAKMAGVPTPDAVLGLPPVTGASAPEPVKCADGHENVPGTKFCTTCATSLAAPGTVRCPDGHESPAGCRFCGECGKSVAADKPPSAAASKTTKTRARTPAATKAA